MKPSVILDPHFRRLANLFRPEDYARLEGSAELIWAQDEAMPEEVLANHREDVSIMIVGRWRHGDVTQFPRLRAIIEVAGSFPSVDDLDYAACFARGIRVLSCAPAFGPAVAEMGLALALDCARQVAWTDRQFRDGMPNWSHSSFTTEIGEPFTLYGKQAGFIGFGGLARALKPLLEPFQCPIQVYDPWLIDSYLESQGLNPVDLDSLLSSSQLIFVLAVPSSSNQALLDRRKLDLIAPNAILVLLSRAHVVDFAALSDKLLAGAFRAGIDVFPEEPLSPEHPIVQSPHAVFSSHRAGAIAEGLLNIGRLVSYDVEAISRGLVPQFLQVAQPEFIHMRGK